MDTSDHSPCFTGSFQDEAEITAVEDGKEYWGLSFDSGGWSLAKSYGREPKVGDKISIRTAQGSKVVGCKINGEMVFNKTDEEVDEEHAAFVAKMKADRLVAFEKEKPDLDRRYAALPRLFQLRIDKFRANNPNFRPEFEAYEMFCCDEAVKIATALGAHGRHAPEGADDLQDIFTNFKNLSYEEQKKLTGLDDGHSGNTFGIAVHLAYLYLKTPENVPKLHGALATLVGSQEYGCVPKDAPEEDLGAAERD